jgi:hypothetical protein
MHSLGLDGRRLRGVFGDVFWPADWHMFTVLDTHDGVRGFEAWDGQSWQKLDLERWYPAHWDGGYRWHHVQLDTQPRLREPFLAAACEKSGAEKVRFVHWIWNVHPGRWGQPRHVVAKVIAERRCNKPPPEPPRGWVL